MYTTDCSRLNATRDTATVQRPTASAYSSRVQKCSQQATLLDSNDTVYRVRLSPKRQGQKFLGPVTDNQLHKHGTQTKQL